MILLELIFFVNANMLFVWNHEGRMLSRWVGVKINVGMNINLQYDNTFPNIRN